MGVIFNRLRGESYARVVHGALVLHAPNATPAVTWRMALDRVHAAQFGVMAHDDHSDLVLGGPKGEFTPIAHFKHKGDADSALVRVTAAMACDGETGVCRRFFGAFFAGLGGTIAVMVAIFLVGWGLYMAQPNMLLLRLFGPIYDTKQAAAAAAPAIAASGALPAAPAAREADKPARPQLFNEPTAAGDALKPPKD